AHGFRSVTMADLAKGLGMSKKTLYVHFASKDELLEAAIQDKFCEGERDLERITACTVDNFLIGVQELLSCLQRHAAEIQPPFMRDVQRQGPEFFKAIENRRREIIQRYFGKFLSKGQEEGIVRQDIPVRLIVEILLSAVQTIMNPVKLTELGLTPQSGFP